MDVNWENRPGSSDTWMSLNLGLLEASFQVTLFISVLVVIREEAFFNLVPSYQFAFRQQRGRREDDHSKDVLNIALQNTTTKTEWFGDSTILEVER